jgi:hypothetical protein
MRSRLVLSLAVLAALGAATAFARIAADAHRPPPIELTFDVPPFPPEVARPFSFGLRSVVADFAFLEAIQVYGGRKPSVTLEAGAHEDRLLAKLLAYATDLDPRFRGAYRFAGDALPRHTTDGKAAGVFSAQLLLKKGVVERPDDWRIHFMLGFIDSYYLEQHEDAARQFADAARIDGSPGYLGLLATRLASHAGDLSFAEQLARTMLAETTEEQTRAEWEKRLLDIDMERRARLIDAAVERFQLRTGQLPATLEALVTAGDLSSIPPEPHGGSYFIDSTGVVRSTAGERLRVRNKAQNQSGLIPQ